MRLIPRARAEVGAASDVTDVTDVSDVTLHEAAGTPVTVDARAYTRAGWFIVLAGVGGFLLWAMFAPLDKGVAVAGTVTVATNRKAVQHQIGGTVEDILVKEGDVVKAGQPLVRMNDIQARSQADMSRVQYFIARAVEARLIAERDGKRSIAFPAELQSARGDPRVTADIGLQSLLFASRQSSLASELAALDENIAGLKIQLRGLEESRDHQKLQLTYLAEQLDGMRELSKEGYVARNRLLDLERSQAQVSGALAESIGNIGHGHLQIAELTLRREQRRQDHQKDVRSQLTDVQKEAAALQHRLLGQDFELSNVVVKAPVDGTVVSLAVFTRGGVVAAGAHLMDIVPSDDALIIEGMVPVNLIDKVRAGLKVELNFSAFNANQTPQVPGIVTQVSADRLTDEKSGQPYYKLKAQVAPEGRGQIAHLEVRPGMPVELFVKTGERTLMSYLFKPVMDRARSALTEE